MNNDFTELLIGSSLASIFAHAADKELKKPQPCDTILKELNLIKKDEVWVDIITHHSVKVIRCSGTTHNDTVEFISLSSDKQHILSLPTFLGLFKHSSLQKNNDKEATTTQTTSTEQNETPDNFNKTKPKTFGFKKAKKLMEQGRWVTRLCSDDSPITLTADGIIITSSIDEDNQVCLTGADITASDWIEVEV